MVDIDIEVPAEAQRMTQLILDQFPGGLIRRRGDSSKLALLYRRADLDGVYKGQGQKRYCHSGGGVVELFDNSGAQMGIFSTGLDGGDYRWDGRSPLDVCLNDLPPLSLEQWGVLRQLLTREGYVAASGGGAVLHKLPKRNDTPQLATGWNEQVFYRVGALVRQGVDTAAILREAEQWREPGYTEVQTQAEVADMVQRWERHIEDNRDPDYEAWRDGWAFEEAGNRYWDLDAMVPILQQALRTTNGHLRGEYIDQSGQTRKQSYCDRFFLDLDAQRVLATTVAPEQPLITDDRISVEHKGRDRHQIDNYARFMFCSNHLDGLPFDENERRFFAIVCQAAEALDADFYARFVELCHSEQGRADIAAWLRSNYSDELPSRPPVSDTALVADALMDDWVVRLAEIVDSSHRKYPVVVIAKDMAKIVEHLTDQRINPTHRTKALKRGGWSIGKINGKQVYWRGDSKPPNIDDDLLGEVCSS